MFALYRVSVNNTSKLGPSHADNVELDIACGIFVGVLISVEANPTQCSKLCDI